MKFSTVLALMATGVSAQFYNITSAPFQLVVKTKGYATNPYAGAVLTACHAGAAIEALCIFDQANKTVANYNTFRFNTSIYSSQQDNTYGEQGAITWILPSAGGEGYSNPLKFVYNTASNVALPLIEPVNDPTLVSFNPQDGRLSVQSYIDDSVSPIAVGQKAYYRWAICKINYSGYQYVALNWIQGSGKAQNPSCVEVDIVRKFI